MREATLLLVAAVVPLFAACKPRGASATADAAPAPVVSASSAPTAASDEDDEPPKPYDREGAEKDLLAILGDKAQVAGVLATIDAIGARCPGLSRNFIATQAKRLLGANLPPGNNLASMLSAMVDLSGVDGKVDRGAVFVGRAWVLPHDRGYATDEDLAEFARIGVSRSMMLGQIPEPTLHAHKIAPAQWATAALTTVLRQYDDGGTLGSACGAFARDR